MSFRQIVSLSSFQCIKCGHLTLSCLHSAENLRPMSSLELPRLWDRIILLWHSSYTIKGHTGLPLKQPCSNKIPYEKTQHLGSGSENLLAISGWLKEFAELEAGLSPVYPSVQCKCLSDGSLFPLCQTFITIYPPLPLAIGSSSQVWSVLQHRGCTRNHQTL